MFFLKGQIYGLCTPITGTIIAPSLLRYCYYACQAFTAHDAVYNRRMSLKTQK